MAGNPYIYAVRRLLLLVLSIQIVSSGQAIGELVKVFNLVDHYLMHRGRGEVSSLADFIRMHYLDPEHRRSDPVRHDRLPLQHPSSNPLPACHTGIPAIHIAGMAPSDAPAMTPRNQRHSPLLRCIDIFQPPRTVC
jgi:hypothetical protein